MRSRRMDATVKSIDYETHTLIIEPVARPRSTSFAWSKQTCFLRNLKFVCPTALGEGTQATIYYRSPFFGPPRVTRIIWRQPNL